MRQSHAIRPMAEESLQLHVQLKFPDQAVCWPCFKLDGVLVGWRVSDIFDRILQHEQYPKERPLYGDEFRLLCRGEQLFLRRGDEIIEDHGLSDEDNRCFRMLASAQEEYNDAVTCVKLKRQAKAPVASAQEKCNDAVKLKAPVVLKISIVGSRDSRKSKSNSRPSPSCEDMQPYALRSLEITKELLQDHGRLFQYAHQPTDVEKSFIKTCIDLLRRLNAEEEQCEDMKQLLIKEETDTKKYAFDVGFVLPLSKAVAAASAAAPMPGGFVASHDTKSDVGKRREKGLGFSGKAAWPFDMRLHHKLHDMLMFGIEELHLDGCSGGQEHRELQKVPPLASQLGRTASQVSEHASRTNSSSHEAQDASTRTPPAQTSEASQYPDAHQTPQDWFSKHAPDDKWLDLDQIMTCWRNANQKNRMKVAPLCEVGANSAENVEDVVKFFDILARREKDRQKSGKPSKLEFQIEGKGALELHRLLGMGFAGKIKVRCSPMKADLKDDYNDKMNAIVQLHKQNDQRLKQTKSNMSLLCLFLFTLARGKMQKDLEAFDPEVVATSSLGIIKTFRSFVSESVLEAELKSYLAIGVPLEFLKSDECSDKYQVQESFRKLARKSFGGNLDDKKVIWLLKPFKNLKRTQKEGGLKSKMFEPSTVDDKQFSVATVIHIDKMRKITS
jgi:hypothetical protein